MKKDTIMFDGYYGFQNVGDDVFCLVAEWIANECWKFNNIYFNGENIPKLYNNSRKNQSTKMNKKIKKLSTLMTLFKSSHIVYAGGSNFHTALSGIGDLRNFYRFSTKFTKKLYALGVSLGPFDTKRDYESIKNYLNNFTYISLRDKRSYEIAKKMNLRGVCKQSFDIASLLPVINKKYYRQRIDNNKKDELVVGISLCHCERYSGKDINREIQREEVMKLLIDKMVEKYKRITLKFFVFNNNKISGDNEITIESLNIFKSKCKVELINYTKDTLWFWNEMKKCNLFIGIRLHSAIMSYMANIPFVLFEYHEKCTEFLNSIGYSQKDRIIVEKFDVIKYLSVIDRLIKNDYKYKLKPSELTEHVLNDIKECANFI
ncbi:polysaccharide pyruvyl transferase family protein [Clostridium pasteurianum]|uniref:Polysaccharide pyruvyl transferase domain-containing protein n=1 Tax=Clostridium pasteurianum BC1 TaxID=86416 RepID=R4JZX3_CLOPA|nr:polysaccharide pyruvyl transferase family protein [Clostridium pasteurianum]AGK95873.1 hypothetical protein Clopa_0849 [Clostridium pasteurianum BC1]